MPSFSRSLLMRYAVSVGSVVLATVLRLLLDPWLGSRFPFATLFFAVLVAAWYGGFGAAVVAALVGALVSVRLLLPPRQSFAVEGFDNQGGFVLYLLVSLGIAVLGGAMRAAWKRAEVQAAEAVRQREQLQATLWSIGDAVIVTDAAGRVGSLNPVAERLTGWTTEEAAGQPLTTIFSISNENTGEAVESPVARVLQAGVVVGLANHSVLTAKDGTERPIDDSAAPIRDAQGNLAGVVLVFRDVTERRRAERELHRQREWFRVTLASIGDAVIATDIKGRVAFLNPAAQTLTGWTQKEAERQPLEAVFQIVNEYTRQPVENPVIQVLRAGAVVGLANHTLLLAKDGTEWPIDDSAAPIQDEQGDLVGVVLIFRDVTERRRAEETRRRLAAIVESCDDAIVGKTLDGLIISWNAGAERLYGYPAAEALGQPFSILVPPERSREVEDSVRRLQRGERLDHFETVRRRKDGRLIDVSVSYSPIRDDEGRQVGTAVITRDITERKRAEQTTRFLADASATLASLVDYESTLQKVARLAVPFFADWCTVDMLDDAGTLRRLAVAHIDPAKVELAHELHRRYPPDPTAPQGVWNILRTGQAEIIPEISADLLVATAQDAELLRILRDLGLKSYLGVPLAVRGRVLGVLTFIAAESGRRYDAADLAVAEDLAHRAAVAIENAHLYQTLREADQRKDEFLALLGHELRNPLAPIRNALHILRLPGTDATIAERAREMMERQVEHLVRLVDDLLDVSRIMRGKVELRRQPVELTTIVTRAVETAQPVIDAESHELTLALAAEPLWVNGDLVRLAQVLANLLNNAAKYTERGGRIGLTAAREGGHAVIRVRDTGIGISSDQLSRIFDMFFQAERRTKNAQGGLGIGLSLVRGLIEMHGGSVEAHSAGPGTGSEFVVRLPLLVRDGRNDEGTMSAAPSPAGQLASCRVLVVDDSSDAADSLAMLLRLEGQEVQVAYDGPSALAQAEADPPAIAFLDLGMPKMDGFELARRFRAHPVLKSVVLVALTGWGQPEDRQRTKEVGFDHHFVKPVEPEALHRLLSGRA